MSPGRVTELSRMSGLLVAPMMKTIFAGPTPSISVKIWLITLGVAKKRSGTKENQEGKKIHSRTQKCTCSRTYHDLDNLRS